MEFESDTLNRKYSKWEKKAFPTKGALICILQSDKLRELLIGNFELRDERAPV